MWDPCSQDAASKRVADVHGCMSMISFCKPSADRSIYDGQERRKKTEDFTHFSKNEKGNHFIRVFSFRFNIPQHPFFSMGIN